MSRHFSLMLGREEAVKVKKTLFTAEMSAKSMYGLEIPYERGDLLKHVYSDPCGWLRLLDGGHVMFSWISVGEENMAPPRVILSPSSCPHDWYFLPSYMRRMRKFMGGINTYLIVPRTLDEFEPNPSYPQLHRFATRLAKK